MSHVVFCLRIAAFPAWAHAQAFVAPSGKPFAIHERGQIVSSSSAALAAGITPGLSLGKARARLQDLELVARDPSLEALAWAEVQHAFYRHTPKIDPIVPGLLFADVDYRRVARLLHDWDEGQGYVGAGVAGDRATAQLAALQALPGATRFIKNDWHHAGRISLANLKSEVAPETIEALAFYGWNTLGHLRPLSRRQLEEQSDAKSGEGTSRGKAQGKNHGNDGMTLFRFAQGAKCKENLRPVPQWSPPEQVTARVAFEFPAREPIEWQAGLTAILEDACNQLGVRSARTLEVAIETPTAPFSARRLLREPASSPKTLAKPLQHTLADALQAMGALPVVLESIELRLGHLTVPDLQPELWEDPRATRNQKLGVALERLESRLPGKVGALVTAQPDSPFEEDVYNWLPALEQLEVRRHAGA